jgi:predicted membrane protein
MVENYFPNIPTRRFLIPIFIIAVGIIMIIRPRRHSYGNMMGDDFSKKNLKVLENWQPFGGSKDTDSSDFLNIDSVFSGVQRTILSKNFQGGKVTCVFGGAEIDLTQADFTGTTILRLEAVFGGIKLIVPPHWQVMNEIDGVFHGVDDKRRSPAGAYNDINKKLILKGSAVFGGIEIRSY